MKNAKRWLTMLLVVIMAASMIHYGGTTASATETSSAETEAVEAVKEADETEAEVKKETEAEKEPVKEKKETEAPETQAPETEAQKAEAEEPEVQETEVPETEAQETAASEVEAAEAEVPEVEAPAVQEEETTVAETVEETEAETEEEKELPTEFVFENKTMVVTATLSDANILPEGAEFVVKEENLSDAEKVLIENTLDDNQMLAGYAVYDMHFAVDGKEVEPANGTVAVSIKYKKALELTAAIEDDKDLQEALDEVEKEYQVLHLEETTKGKKVVDVTDLVNETKAGRIAEVGFTTDGFSKFVVVSIPEGGVPSTSTDVFTPTFADLLNGYNVVCFGDLTLNTHCYGALLVKGNLSGSVSFADAGGRLAVSSFVKGKVNNKDNSGLTVHTGGLASNGTHKLYVGDENEVYYLVNSNNGNPYNEYYLNGQKLYGKSQPNDVAAYKDENYVDFDQVLQTVKGAASGLKAGSEKTVEVKSQGQKIEIASGENVTISCDSTALGMDQWSSYIVNITADSNKEALLNTGSNTVINILDKGEVYLPQIVINDKQLDNSMASSGDYQNGDATNIIWNIPNATKVYLSSCNFVGHVIAPQAEITGGANHNGTLICNTSTISSEGHLWIYSGTGFTNTPSDPGSDTGSLKITKTFTGRDITNAQKSKITFTVTGPDDFTPVTFTYDKMTNGVMVLDNLPTGEYTVLESNAGLDDYILTTTYSVQDGKTTVTKDAQAEVTVTNNYIQEDLGDGVIRVNKTVLMDGSLALTDVDRTFYVALFSDPECTNRVSRVKELNVLAGTSGAVAEFTGLALETYYVCETDEAGNALPTMDERLGFTPMNPDVPFELTEENKEASADITNIVWDEGYYYGGQIVLTKTVVYEGTASADDYSDEQRTFYFELRDAEGNKVETAEELKLTFGSDDEEQTLTIPDLTVNQGGDTVYILVEVDEDGNEVAGSDMVFTVSGDGTQTVTLNPDNHYSDKEAAFTNTFNGDDGQTVGPEDGDEGGEEIDEPDDNDGDETEKKTVKDGESAVKTGVTTHSGLFAGIIVLALFALAVVFTLRRRSTK